MPLWKLILAYDGTAFHGWQVQPRLPTVQGTLAAALEHLTGEAVLPQGSGRTDAGVHALGQVVSFTLAVNIAPERLLRALNRALPPAIRVLEAAHATPGFHARHSAVRKTYEYRLFPSRLVDAASAGQPRAICPPTLAPYVWDCPWPIDSAALQLAARTVLGEHDFTSFAACDPDETTRTLEHASRPSNVRTILHSCWRIEPGLLRYTVAGTGFLHHMVRNLVGTFVEVARGAREPAAIIDILAARDRSAAGPTAPARGLFLHHVDYADVPAEATP